MQPIALARRALALASLLLACAAVSAEEYAATWGPAVGAALPVLEAPDHTGRTRTFQDLAGPRGLLLFMNRSTEW